MNDGTQVQSFGEIRIAGQGNQLVINQIIQIAVAEIKTRAFIAASPYVGLARFEERHKDFFFGRDALIAKLLGLVATKNLVLCTGASGSGKSSLVRSGLTPQLTRRFPQGRLRPLVLTPDRDPFVSLRATLLAAGLTQAQTAEVRSDSELALPEVLHRLRPRAELWLLFVDQFEEVFTLCSDNRIRTHFLDSLVTLSQAASGEIKVVLAMRADFFDRLGAYPELVQLAEAGLCMVSDMQASELRAAIEQPAARHGVVFEEGLVDQIIADVRDRPGALPLLQYTLDLLWVEDNPYDDRTLNTANYHRLGGIEGALRQRADSIFKFSDVTAERERLDFEKELMRRIFLHLVDLTSLGLDARAVSKRAKLSDFHSAEDRRLLAELIDDKLLVSNAAVSKEPSAGAATIELAHEALLSAWPLLKVWIEQARELIYVRNRLSADAQRWQEVAQDKRKRAEEELWAGTRLAQAQELQARGDFRAVLGGLSQAEEAFLAASLLLSETRTREESERREQLARMEIDKQQALAMKEIEKQQALANEAMEKRHQRALYRLIGLGIVGGASILLAGVLIFAFRQSSLAKERQLDLWVDIGRERMVDGRWSEALPWLNAAYQEDSNSPHLPLLLEQARRSSESQVAILHHDGPVRTAAFNSEGNKVVTASDDKTVVIWVQIDPGHAASPSVGKGPGVLC